MPDVDVLICGAGAGGLTLAHFLGRQGRRVLIVDKQSKPRNVHKGELIQPQTVQILDAAGLIEPLAERGVRTVRRLSCGSADGSELISLDYGLLDPPFNYGLLHHYKDLREAVGSQLGPTVEYLQGTRAESLLTDSHGRITGARLMTRDGPLEATARLTVACDGQVSRLRAAANIVVPVRRYPHQLMAFQLDDVPELGEDMSMYLTPKGLRVLFQMPGARARLYVQILANQFREIGRARLEGWLTQLLRETPALERVRGPLRAGMHNVQVLSAARFHSRVWRVPGLVLLGDTAHGVHPMVGQGMNAAIGDAWCLAQQLTSVGSLTADAADVVAARYEAERRPVLDYVARLSHTLAMIFTNTSRGVHRLRPHLLRRNWDNDPLRRRIVTNVAGFSSDTFTTWAVLSALGVNVGKGRTA